MPKPKPSISNNDEDDISVIKKALERLENNQTQILKQNDEFKLSLKEIENLKKENLLLQEQNKIKDRKIAELDDRVEMLEQYTRSENIVVSGLSVKTTSSFSDSVKLNTEKETEVVHDTVSVEKQLVSFFNEKNIPIKSEDISVCHPIGKKPVRDIVVRCVSRKTTNMILFKAKKEKCLEGTDVYVSEHLTKNNLELAAIGRQLRFLKQISQTWVRGGKVFIRTKGKTAEDERTIFIKNKAAFQELGFEIDNIFDSRKKK